MNNIIKFIPTLLFLFIAYFLFYKIYPAYQNTYQLVQKFNELKSREEQVKAIEASLEELKNTETLQTLIKRRSSLNNWIPPEPKIEELYFSLAAIFSSANMNFKGFSFNIEEEKNSSYILPLKVIRFNLDIQGNEDQVLKIVKAIESNVRIMKIRKFSFNRDKKASLEVEAYFLPEK